MAQHTYSVDVSKTATAQETIEVVASSTREARRIALGVATEQQFAPHRSDYSVDGCRRVGEGATCEGEQIVIEATVTSDDQALSETFDAVGWFEMATDDAICSLSVEHWGPGEVSDLLAYHALNENAAVSGLMRYVEIRSGAGDAVGFSVRVSKAHALAWLQQNRSALYQRVVDEE